MMGELLAVLGLAFALFAVAVAAMAVGVVFRRPCLRGSCGGAAARGPGGVSLGCIACPRRRGRR